MRKQVGMSIIRTVKIGLNTWIVMCTVKNKGRNVVAKIWHWHPMAKNKRGCSKTRIARMEIWQRATLVEEDEVFRMVYAKKYHSIYMYISNFIFYIIIVFCTFRPAMTYVNSTVFFRWILGFVEYACIRLCYESFLSSVDVSPVVILGFPWKPCA